MISLAVEVAASRRPSEHLKGIFIAPGIAALLRFRNGKSKSFYTKERRACSDQIEPTKSSPSYNATLASNARAAW